MPHQAELDIDKIIDAQIFPTLILGQNDLVGYHNQPMIDLLNNFSSQNHASHIGADIWRLIHIPEIAEVFEQVKQSKQATQSKFEYFDNGVRHFRFSISPISVDDKSYNYWFSFRDLTQEIVRERMRADFIANASHELRTPLASIAGFIETLQGPAKDDIASHHKFLNIMQEQSGRMTRLIDDLLSLSKIELNQHMKPTDMVNLNDIIEHCFHTFEPLAKAQKVVLKLENKLEKAHIYGDRDQLIQLLTNLLNNALKYGMKNQAENEIILRLTENDAADKIILSIIDFGDGIEEEDLPRLTERFYRVKHSQKVRGTGLGLAIVKHIAQHHDAVLNFESQVNEGTQVFLTFDKI